MARGFQVIVLLMLTVVGGCAANQPAQQALAMVPGQASVTISRHSGYYGALLPVEIDANGTQIASLSNGESYRGSVPAGPITLSASMTTSPGRYSVRFVAESGKNYSFEVTARGEQFAATVLGGVVGLAADTAVNGEQSGAVRLTMVAAQ